jgi:hypothetical protein
MSSDKEDITGKYLSLLKNNVRSLSLVVEKGKFIIVTSSVCSWLGLSYASKREFILTGFYLGANLESVCGPGANR